MEIVHHLQFLACVEEKLVLVKNKVESLKRDLYI